MPHTSFLRRLSMIRLLCLIPALMVFLVFWLLPMIWLVALPAQKGWGTYFAVLTHTKYLISLVNTITLSLVVTFATIVFGSAVGLFLARHQFFGRASLLALLTLPLSFPGVIIGFFLILLGGRQGLIADISELILGERLTLAYGVFGLFLAYLYFSLPRAISTYAAAAEKIDLALEEAARSLGATRYRIILDVWIPELAPTTLACAAIIFSTSMGAFGTAFTLATKFEVLPITIYSDFTNYANFALAAALSFTLGIATWCVLYLARRYGDQSILSS